MKTIKHVLLTIALLLTAVLALGVPAFAASFTFTGTGNVGGVPQNGSVTFTIDPNDLMITLTNTGGPGQVGDIASELDGLLFSVTGGSPVFNAASLSGSDPNGAINCHQVAANTCLPAVVVSPFGWAFSGGPTFALQAGSGSFKPEAIVNNNITSPGGSGGTSNDQHNPLLLGPVTFTIGFTGTAPTGIGNVVLQFGTGPANITTGPIPEPAYSSVLLLGLVGVGLFLRRRKPVVAE
jgi:hypothetical protein